MSRIVYDPRHYRAPRSMREATGSDFRPLDDRPHRGDRWVFVGSIVLALFAAPFIYHRLFVVMGG